MGKGTKTEKLFIDDYGQYLGCGKGCFVVRDKNKNTTKKYPLFEEKLSEIIIKTGNTISAGALSTCAFWEIDLLVLTRKGKPAGYLRSVNYDSHAETRIAQYKAYTSTKALDIIKQIVYAKLKSQNIILKKHGLRQHDLLNINHRLFEIESDNLSHVRKIVTGIEGYRTRRYFKKIFRLLPSWLKPQKRNGFEAYDNGNNLFNLAYTILNWKVHRAILKAHLDGYLGFLHSLQHGKPSLVCDLQELYRYLIDDFLIKYSKTLKKKDFKPKRQRKNGKTGKRMFLTNQKTTEFVRSLYKYFQKKVDVPRIRHGKKQEIETLINEECYLFAKYLREERETWIPRIVEMI